MRRKHIEATKDLTSDLTRRKEALVIATGLEEKVQNMFRHKKDETVEVHTRITEIQCDAL